MAFDQAGNLTGLSIDLSTRLGSALGRPVRFVRLGWRDLIPALTNGEIDVIASGMTITRAREFRRALGIRLPKSATEWWKT